MNSESVVTAARKYCGVPIVEGGRSTSGIDCVGLVLLTAQDLGLSLPKEVPANYGFDIRQHPKDHEARTFLSQHMVQTHPPGAPYSQVVMSAQPGDVALFAVSGIAISLAIISETSRMSLSSLLPIKKLIGGLHQLGESFQEYDFSWTWGCAISNCYRFRELAGDQKGVVLNDH